MILLLPKKLLQRQMKERSFLAAIFSHCFMSELVPRDSFGKYIQFSPVQPIPARPINGSPTDLKLRSRTKEREPTNEAYLHFFSQIGALISCVFLFYIIILKKFNIQILSKLFCRVVFLPYFKINQINYL